MEISESFPLAFVVLVMLFVLLIMVLVLFLQPVLLVCFRRARVVLHQVGLAMLEGLLGRRCMSHIFIILPLAFERFLGNSFGLTWFGFGLGEGSIIHSVTGSQPACSKTT